MTHPAHLVEVGETFFYSGRCRKVLARERMSSVPHFPPSWGYRLEDYKNLVSEGALLGEVEYYRRRDAMPPSSNPTEPKR